MNFFPNVAILTKSATPGEVQLTFAHASVGKKSLGESVTALNLAESLEAPIVISIAPKLPLPTAEKRFGSLSPRYSFALPLATSPD